MRFMTNVKSISGYPWAVAFRWARSYTQNTPRFTQIRVLIKSRLCEPSGNSKRSLAYLWKRSTRAFGRLTGTVWLQSNLTQTPGISDVDQLKIGTLDCSALPLELDGMTFAGSHILFWMPRRSMSKWFFVDVSSTMVLFFFLAGYQDPIGTSTLQCRVAYLLYSLCLSFPIASCQCDLQNLY